MPFIEKRKGVLCVRVCTNTVEQDCFHGAFVKEFAKKAPTTM